MSDIQEKVAAYFVTHHAARICVRDLARGTGLGRGQVYGALQRLHKQRRVRHVGKGIYAFRCPPVDAIALRKE
jgi:hypothetical protein